MLKLQAAFSKKVPGEQEYSSKGYSATIEVELPDGLNEFQLKEKIHQTFTLVQVSVEAELQNSTQQVRPSAPALQPAQSSHTPIQKPGPISAKQLKYVNDLLRDTKFDPTQFLQQTGLNSVYELSKQQSSQLIDLMRGTQKAA